MIISSPQSPISLLTSSPVHKHIHRPLKPKTLVHSHFTPMTMFRRLISRQLRLQFPLHRPILPPAPPIPLFNFTSTGNLHLHSLRLFSTSGRDGSDDPNNPWTISPESDESESSIFSTITGSVKDSPFGSVPLGGFEEQWTIGEDKEKENIFSSVERLEADLQQIGVDQIEDDSKQEKEEVDIEELKKKEKELMKTLKGQNRAFGDLISTSGITEGMLDSLILLKDVSDVPGLPPLKEIEDKAIAKLNSDSYKSENRRKNQDEVIVRVKQVDSKGRAYGTGRRKCSVARVWIWPGEGKFSVNDMEFDVYFPILDHRVELLRPFTVTDTLGKWDVRSTVKGGGVSGQVGAIRLGISRALQNFEPAYRPYLKAVGYLTRDPRMVERKKPGKAKARKSFQWVKR